MPDVTVAGRTLVMGVLNVTPDSFSDGGQYLAPDAAIERGLALSREGAAIVDVGGESTRPGASRVDPETEQRRVIPVIEALAAEGVAVSVDTMRAATARVAIDAGAVLVNDVSGGLADPDMVPLIADSGVEYVAMHWRAHSESMDALDEYDNVVAAVRDELGRRLDVLAGAGVALDKVVLDPGLGFAKVTASNWPLLAHIDAWSAGQRVLIGASRKRFLAAAISPSGVPDPAASRESATSAVTALAAWHGVWAVRVHDARAAADAIAVVSAWQNGADETP